MVKSVEVNITYCSTDNIIGGYFTNLLQGYKFIFKGKILNMQIRNYVTVPTIGDILQGYSED